MTAGGSFWTVKHRVLSLLVTFIGALFAGCSRAPALDVLGSFFPAWLVCFIVAIVLTAIVRLVLVRLRIQLALPILVYPALTALFTFVLWLIFFH
jgi:fructose-specific phosphotransferase system IIC component